MSGAPHPSPARRLAARRAARIEPRPLIGLIRRRIVVRGRVQGVNFRASCRRRALELGVSGTATNCSDGSVEVVVEGTPDSVDALVAWLREGPPASEVEDVEVRDERPEGIAGFATA